MTTYRTTAKAPLRARNTFGVDARAPLLVEIDAIDALPRAFDALRLRDRDVLLLGGGSNLLFAGDAPDVVLSIAAARTAIASDDGNRVVLRAEAGVDWHALVMDALAQGLHGLENLALIPGTAGAAPIQNIGAYGVEVDTLIDGVHVFERATGRMQRLNRADCAFAYRDSAFKRAPDRWIVTAVDFALSRSAPPVLEYAALRDELDAMAIAAPTARQVADAVIAIRRRKLPDPARLGNAGSFFKNPIVPAATADALLAQHTTLPTFRGDSDHTRKLSAAWLIDACGWKGHREAGSDAAVSADHALVLVNHGHATGMQLLDLARRIAASVQARFGVPLEPEPRIVGGMWQASASTP